MTTPKGPNDPIDPKLIRKLADILRETELSEIEVEQGGLKIRVARQAPVPQAVSYMAAPQMAPQAYAQGMPQAAPQPSPMSVPSPSPSSETAATATPPKDAIKSPMVGTVYLQPQPGSPAFIKVGDKVKQGQTLLIIEAMKTMNPIPSPREGTVSEILVADGQPVEFGEALVAFE
ncbi:MAG: acetyl-CoA carboxylase biotin carboxyl carrier protein [Asticcacaulis sp.]